MGYRHFLGDNPPCPCFSDNLFCYNDGHNSQHQFSQADFHQPPRRLNMPDYKIPQIAAYPKAEANQAYLVASGDLRLSANQTCWPAQADMESKIRTAFAAEGIDLVRAHPYDEAAGHGFIWNQRMGMDVFKSIPPDAPLIVAEAVWQYSYHVLAGLRDHRGPILTVANWSGQWPGLVGMLNLNGCLTKMGVKYSTIWSEDFETTISS